MRLHIRCKNLELSEEMREQARSRLAFALARFGHRIKEVTTSLADLNGRKGGIDKQCHLVVSLRPKGNVAIVETATNVCAAIAQAADRAGNSVGRALKRRRDAKINRDGQHDWRLLQMRQQCVRCLPAVRCNVPIGTFSRHESLLMMV